MEVVKTCPCCADSPHNVECVCNSLFGISQMEFREPSPIDGLNVIEYPDDSDPFGVSYSICSDVSLLFDQKRLNSVLGVDNVRVWLNSLGESASSLIPKNLSDEQLFSAVKSRHIQGLSDLRAWNDEMLLEASRIENEAKDLIDQYNSSRSSVEQSPAPSSE